MFTVFPIKITSSQSDFMFKCINCKLPKPNRGVCNSFVEAEKKTCLLTGFIYTLIIAYSGEL